jgi:signal transduction histidine kinase
MPSEVSIAGAHHDREPTVEELKRDLAESREQQAATAEILAAISSSPIDAQRAFAKIAASAARLCDAYDATIYQVDGSNLNLVAHHGPIPQSGTFHLSRGLVIGRAIIDRRTIHVADLQAEIDEYPEGSDRARHLGHRANLAVPLLRAGKGMGVISIRRREVRPFTDRQIELLKTFANQAVIAIENTRLFEEVQARTRELTESLEYQTATSEILRIISSAPTELQPVFDAIAASATRLCGALLTGVYRFDGKLIHFVAHDNWTDEGLATVQSVYPRPPSRDTQIARAILDRTVAEVRDFENDPDVPSQSLPLARALGYRSLLAVPMLHEGKPIGAIAVARSAAGPFSAEHIELVKVFADQAVIAIENARLFEEVQARTRELARSVGELKALGEVGQAVSSSLDLNVVLPRILEHACALSDTDSGAIYAFDPVRGEFDLAADHNMSEEVIAAVRAHPIRLGESLVGQCGERREAMQFADLTVAPSHPLIAMHIKSGVGALLAVPLMHQDEVIGALVVRRRSPGEFSAAIIAIMETFANQSAIAVQNARLYNEIARKSRELEIASQHKSQFVANMSHELRTPLAAILGYAELMQEGFYEPLGQKSLDALTRIRSNGRHLLSLINTVLDIAKIESGQFTLNMAEYDIESVVETVRSATESLAQNKKLALKTEVAKKLPLGVGDEQRLTQVLLNVVGNAIKFTDAGEVRIAAGVRNGHFAVSVTDTGPGIPLDQQARIFDQFHQVDSSLTKAKGGTGLGLAIAKQIVEMHGGRIWVESTPGKGSTFQMELPTRAEFRKRAL